jgi:AraC-like DNA-binding protein
MTDVLQKSADHYDPRGVLDPAGFHHHVTFLTYSAPPDLMRFLEHFWVIRWDKAGDQPYFSEQLMHRPYVDLYVSKSESGMPSESGIQSTFRNKRTYTAAGTGRIVGVRFRPGAFHAFWNKSLSGLKDKIIDVQQAFPEMDDRYVQQLLSLDDQAAVHMLAGTLRDKNPRPDPHIDLINELIDAIENNGELQTVKAVARQFHRSERWIQQLFQEYVGIGLKWMLQRNKLLEAAKHIRESDDPDWAAIAYDLGYSSQQHFITDFKRVLGKTPLQYKKELALQ